MKLPRSWDSNYPNMWLPSHAIFTYEKLSSDNHEISHKYLNFFLQTCTNVQLDLRVDKGIIMYSISFVEKIIKLKTIGNFQKHRSKCTIHRSEIRKTIPTVIVQLNILYPAWEMSQIQDKENACCPAEILALTDCCLFMIFQMQVISHRHYTDLSSTKSSACGLKSPAVRRWKRACKQKHVFLTWPWYVVWMFFMHLQALLGLHCKHISLSINLNFIQSCN